MKTAIFTATRRPGLDVTWASIKRQNRDDLMWIVGDEIWRQRQGILDPLPIDTIHFNTANMHYVQGGTSLASAYHHAIELARVYDLDLLISVQDYIWFPDDGVAKFEAMAKKYPNSLLTGLCSHSSDPGPEKVFDINNPWTIFKEPYEDKPQNIVWNDVRANDGDWIREVNPMEWEINYAAIPRAPLHDPALQFDREYDRGIAYENQDMAMRAQQLGYNTMIDPSNHAISLPHKVYFKAEAEALGEIVNQKFHHERWGIPL